MTAPIIWAALQAMKNDSENNGGGSFDPDPNEKPKNGPMIGDDGELIEPIEVEQEPGEKPKRGVSQHRRTLVWVFGFISGFLLMVLAYNLIPGLRPADHHIYPADDMPRTVVSSTPVPLPGQGVYPDLLNTAANVFAVLFPAFGVIVGMGLTVSLLRYVISAVRNTF